MSKRLSYRAHILHAYRTLVEHATDDEADTMLALVKREGALWDCVDDDDRTCWTNTYRMRKCESCGKPRP
jgi:hypothetical protein